jgi:hypothetical protein
LFRGAQRIARAETWKAVEIAIRCVELRLVLNRKGSKMSVRRQIPTSTGGTQQTEKDLGMSFAGMERGDMRSRQPGRDDLASHFDRQRVGGDLPMSGES